MNLLEELEKELKEVRADQERINSLYRKNGLTEDLFLIPVINPPLKGARGMSEQQIKINDVQVITTLKGSAGLEFFDSQGKSYKTKPSANLNDIEKKLLDFPQFFRTHESFIVNFNHLDYFAPSETDTQGRTLVFKNTGVKAPLSSGNVDQVKKYFKTGSLEHVEPWNREYQAIIDENLRSFEKEIRFMSADELKANFKYKATGEFNIREFMANMIWEYYTLLQLGKRDPIEGNIRTFWYYIKPTLSKATTINSQSQYGIMIDVFRELVVTHGLFKYKDFGFVSDDTGNYVLGTKHPNIILAGEKSGHFRKLQRLQEEFGITIISLGGMPSILNTEYFADELEKLVNLKDSSIYLITLVDYNPSSAIIAKTFVTQIQHEGVKNLDSIGHLLTPASFPPEELPHVTDQIPMNTPADKTKVRKWLEAGGGIDLGDGIKQPLGIECEALILDFERLKTLFKKEFDKIINPPTRAELKSYDPLAMDLSELNINLFPV
jgi:hypothetical protein